MSKDDDNGVAGGCVMICAVLAIGGATLLCRCSGGIYRGYSKGVRAGIVNKFSEKGWIYKSGEGELTIGTSYTSTHVWDFSVIDPSVAAEVDKAANSGKRVRLYYEQYAIRPISQDTDYTIVRVEADE